jgi:hypothetical protein
MHDGTVPTTTDVTGPDDAKVVYVYKYMRYVRILSTYTEPLTEAEK